MRYYRLYPPDSICDLIRVCDAAIANFTGYYKISKDDPALIHAHMTRARALATFEYEHGRGSFKFLYLPELQYLRMINGRMSSQETVRYYEEHEVSEVPDDQKIPDYHDIDEKIWDFVPGSKIKIPWPSTAPQSPALSSDTQTLDETAR